MPDEIAALRAIGFDGLTYRTRYPDLVALPENGELQHFSTYGLLEGREASLLGPLEPALARLPALWPEHLRRHAMVRALVRGRYSQTRAEPFAQSALSLLSAPHGFPAVIVVGDSHSNLHHGTGVTSDTLVLHLLCSGASARGLSNPQSRGGFAAQVLGALEAIRTGYAGASPPVLMQFGQVDIEFVYNFHRLRDPDAVAFDEADYMRFADESIAHYMGFLQRLSKVWPKPSIMVAGVHPPTLSDAFVREGYQNAHIAFLNEQEDRDRLSAGLARLEFPDQARRTALQRWFNDRLGARCGLAGFGFVNTFPRFCGSDGLVAADLVQAHGGGDHHLDFHAPHARAVSAEVIAALTRGAMAI